MGRTLTTIMVTALISAALLLVATLAFESWYWRLYSEAQAIQSASAGADAVVVNNPYQIEESVLTYIPMFIALCAASTFWVVFVVVPSLLASRRLFADALARNLVAAAIVCVLSGVTFALVFGRTSYISPIATFLAGGAIGFVSIALVIKMLPLDTSFGRTREV
jgi:hypothetical protein